MKKKLFLLLTVAAFLMPSCSDDLGEEHNHVTSEQNKELREKQKDASSLAMNLSKSLCSNVTKSGVSDYPDYYGGTYINENGDLVVLVVGDTAQYKPVLSKMAKSSNIIVEPCRFSYNTLLKTIDQLNELIINKETTDILQNFKIQCFGIQDNKNTVFVALEDCSSTNISLFKQQVLDSPNIVFEQAEGKIEFNYTELYPGSRITTSVGGSMGYRALLNGTPGFVMSGHVAKGLNVPVYYYNELVGYTSKLQVYGAVDAAFVPTGAFFSPSNLTIQRNVLSSRDETMGVNSIVNMEGMISGYQWGAVTRTNLTISGTAGGMSVTITNVTAARYNCDEGDSGGVVYSDANNIVGIHEAKNKTTGEAYYVLAKNINAAFGLTLY